MQRGVASLAVVASLALATRPARAGCENTCDVVLEPVSATPALPACAQATLSSQTCLCEVWLMLKNSCATPLDTVDFGFQGCPAGGPCSVPPSAQNSVALAADGDGKKQWLLHVRNDNTDYALSISVTVANFNGSPQWLRGGQRPRAQSRPRRAHGRPRGLRWLGLLASPGPDGGHRAPGGTGRRSGDWVV
jgi:hypothetical protein